MPKWAATNPLHLWEAADAYERKNGTTYREFEIALPCEMNPAQRLDWSAILWGRNWRPSRLRLRSHRPQTVASAAATPTSCFASEKRWDRARPRAVFQTVQQQQQEPGARRRQKANTGKPGDPDALS